MKLKEAFTPEFFALNQLIASRSIELYEACSAPAELRRSGAAQFELGEPSLTDERRKELLQLLRSFAEAEQLEDKIKHLSCSLGAWKMMKDFNQDYDANF